MNSDDDTSSTTSIAKQRLEEERRRSRLYGSNARRVKAGSVKKKKKKQNTCTSPPCTETIPTCGTDGSPSPKSSTNKDLNHSGTHEESRQNELAKPRPWAQANKFVDPTKAECVQSRPWHVGYINATTASGNPSAQAARYGPDGAFNLHIQCTDRVSRHGKLEAILRSDDDTHNNVEQYNSISNVWNEPLRLGGEDHSFSTPKMWGNKGHCRGKKSDEDQLPRRLKKSLDHDTDLWKEMAASVRKERDKRREKIVPRPTCSRSSTGIIQRKQVARASSHQSQRVFCLR